MTNNSNEQTKRIVHAYPLSQWERLANEEGSKICKIVHIVRHAEGTHNVGRAYNEVENRDARLTEKGHDQCRALAEKCASAPEGTVLHRLLHPSTTKVNNNNKNNNNNVLVVTSSMTRCVETALESFPTLAEDPTIPFVANEDIRETVNYECDRRRPLVELQKDFSRVDFGTIQSNEDGIWKHYEERLGVDYVGPKESAELYTVAERGRRFWQWLSEQPEQQVVVCTHSAFLRCTMSWGQTGGVAMQMEQRLDERPNPTNEPIFRYHSSDDDDKEEDFETYLRADYANCELRSFVMVIED